ncbi:hypothetical protein [Photobacterium sanguinicancri]|uniref:hypothetical protein n=1 Tax=Photobacterium sanguinicancri TaxID=875932 RepID=UPI0026E28508|nr:hypothetical protein [Photobacterium sanguinicancri]MDO6497888.1 hypothetical protein [Photobacterium sanguinicancri]
MIRKLPCRLSYHPNALNPTSFMTNVPHPQGKSRVVRKPFYFLDCEEAAMQKAINFSNRRGKELWGLEWKEEGKLLSMRPSPMKGKVAPKSKSRITGVRYGERQVRLKSGRLRVYAYWYTTWYVDGNQKRKQFGYGGKNGRKEADAFNAAVAHRNLMEQKYYKG